MIGKYTGMIKEKALIKLKLEVKIDLMVLKNFQYKNQEQEIIYMNGFFMN